MILEQKGKDIFLQMVKDLSGIANIQYIRQKEVKGLEVTINNKFIEHNPFIFYNKFLLKDRSLECFYKTLEKKIIVAKVAHEKIKETFTKNNTKEKIYFMTFKKLNDKNISKEMQAKILNMFGEQVLKFCQENKLIAVFTTAEKRARLEEVHTMIKRTGLK